MEKYRLDIPNGVIARLSINGAEFWLGDRADDQPNEVLGGNSVRLILTVPEPELFVEKAVAAGATEIFPVQDDHGWRLGRIADPFGLHWEIGYEL